MLPWTTQADRGGGISKHGQQGCRGQRSLWCGQHSGWVKEAWIFVVVDPDPASAPKGRAWWVGKGVAMVILYLVHHSTMMPCFNSGPDFFHKLFLLWISIVLFLQAVSSQPTAVAFLGLLSKPTLSSTQPPPHQERETSGWSMQRCSMNNACRCYSVLPFKDWLLHSFWSPEAPSMIQLIYPPWGDFPKWASLSSSSAPPDLLVSFFLIVFLSYVFTQLCGTFPCPFRYLRPFTSVKS